MTDERFIDNWVALMIAVLGNVSSNDALMQMGFQLQPKVKRTWTAKDIEDIDKMIAAGMDWDEIAKKYDTRASTIKGSWQYHKNKERERELEERRNKYIDWKAIQQRKEEKRHGI